ncbi:beta-propeller fold lactonase family protein [Brevibacillus sp. SYSU BS000544]|uniref:YVTN family beta-propeller repeat protein n=1 Tax=Brevibacillus sp. SYSU BS000544 TaxID=3416443 RepID=UPI003CE460B0
MNKTLFIAISIAASLAVTACGNATKTQTASVSNAQPQQAQASQASQAPASNPQALSNIEKTGGFIYTANQGGISKVDVASQKVIETIQVDGAVHNIQVSDNGQIIGATVVPASGGHSSHGGSHGSTNGFAHFYDAASGKLLQKVEVGKHPAHLVFTADDKYALVTNNEGNDVSLIEMSTYQVAATIPVGNGPHGFRISQDSKYAYIANMNEDSVSVIDLNEKKEWKKIKVGQTPVTTGVTSDGKLLTVTLNQENALALVDLTTDQVTKVPVGIGPAQVYIQPDNKFAFVANQGTKEAPSHSVSKVDLQSKKVTATIETGKGAHGVTTSEDGRFVYVTNMYENTVSIVGNQVDQVIATVPVGEEPNGITFLGTK